MNKARDYWNSLGITVKYVITITLIIIPFILGALFTSSKNDDMNYYGISFNIVQTERMRTFLISDHVQRISSGELDGDSYQVLFSTGLLNEQLTIYENHIVSLRDGNNELDLPKVENEEIASQAFYHQLSSAG